MKSPRFGFIVITSYRSKRDGTHAEDIPVPIRDRRRLAAHLSRVAKKGHWVTRLTVLTWDQAKAEGKNPWA